MDLRIYPLCFPYIAYLPLWGEAETGVAGRVRGVKLLFLIAFGNYMLNSQG